MTLRSEYRQKTPMLREAEERAMPIYVLKSNTILQMQASLTSIFSLEVDPREAALRETEEAIGLVQRQSEAGRADARRTPTSGGSSTRWPSGPTSSRARAAASRTAGSGSTPTRRGRPGDDRADRPGGTGRRASRTSRCTRSSSTAPTLRRSCAFWSAALGYVQWFEPFDGWAGLKPPPDDPRHGLPLIFQRVPEPKVVKNRAHVDYQAMDRATEVERLVGLGATVVREVAENDMRWTVMADPAGNEFCVAQG